MSNLQYNRMLLRLLLSAKICGKRGHAALDYYHHSKYSFQGQAPLSSLTAMMAQSSYYSEQVWIADTCASHHMVGNASHLRNVTSCDVTENFTVGNGEGQAHQANCFSGQACLSWPANKVLSLASKAPPFVVSVSNHIPSSTSNIDSSLTSSQSSVVPSHASTSFGGDPVLVASSADSIENLQVLSAQQLQVFLPPFDSSSPSMSPYMHPMQTRSKSGVDNTKPFEDYHCYLTIIPPLYEAAEPATYKAAS
ncbi:unnamed protein product [Prunus armeniaca]